MYYVYIVECRDGTLYTGITNNVSRRFQEHISSKGGSYTSAKKVSKLLYTEECANRSTALKREAQIKGWRREKKLNLIKESTGFCFKKLHPRRRGTSDQRPV